MKTLLLLDTETTGLPEDQGELCEVGMVLWSVPHRAIISASSRLVAVTGTCTKTAEGVHGITDAMLAEAKPLDDGVMLAAVQRADAVVAYNAEFDRQWFAPEVQQHRWLCAMDDFTYPRGGGGKSLMAVALAHGVGITRAHRALDDCFTMAALLERACELGMDIEAALARACGPKFKYAAEVSFQRNQLAKDRGFRWDPNTKTWWRWMLQSDAEQITEFRVRPMAKW